MTRYFTGGVLVVEREDRILLLIGAEKPASFRSRRAFKEGSWEEVTPPKEGYLEGAVGCREVITIRRPAPNPQPIAAPAPAAVTATTAKPKSRKMQMGLDLEQG